MAQWGGLWTACDTKKTWFPPKDRANFRHDGQHLYWNDHLISCLSRYEGGEGVGVLEGGDGHRVRNYLRRLLLRERRDRDHRDLDLQIFIVRILMTFYWKRSCIAVSALRSCLRNIFWWWWCLPWWHNQRHWSERRCSFLWHKGGLAVGCRTSEHRSTLRKKLSMNSFFPKFCAAFTYFARPPLHSEAVWSSWQTFSAESGSAVGDEPPPSLSHRLELRQHLCKLQIVSFCI